MKTQKNLFALAALCSLLCTLSAFGAGYEKTTMWSGRYAALGGAASSITQGAQSLYFNPAGLAAGPSDASANVSVTGAKFEGPVYKDNVSFESIRAYTTPLGVLGNFKINDKLGIALGSYVSGGTRAMYENVDFTQQAAAYAQFFPNVESAVTIMETALGAGIEPVKGLRLGAAWRMIMARATISTVVSRANTGLVQIGGNNNNLANIKYDNLSATRYNGFKLGAQYNNESNDWGLGATWRSQIDMDMSGDIRGKWFNVVSSSNTDITTGSGTISTSFPQQISLGGFGKVSPSLKLIGEYTWTEYGIDQALPLSGSFDVNGTTLNLVNYSIGQFWRNQSNYRVGAEYALDNDTTVRCGYVLTTQVTANDRARSTFSPPGSGHTITAGLGKALSDKLTFDGALEYSMASGSVTEENRNGYTTSYLGDYKVNAYTAHLGVNYLF